MNFDERRKHAIREYNRWIGAIQPRILVGAATCGQASGAEEVIKAINETLKEINITATVHRVGCMGLCYAEPLVDIIRKGRPRITYGKVTPESVKQIIKDYLLNDDPRPDLAMGCIGDWYATVIPRLFDLPMLRNQVRIASRNCGLIDPENIDHYIARNGYNGFVKALSMTPDAVIEEIKKSGLRGRGGAGFPTGMKWEFCRKAKGDKKFIVCNADEGDPGAFVNRVLLESDPHTVLEGMLIGAYAIGASEGYIYIRAEYPMAVERLEHAIKKLYEYSLIGKNILGSNFSFNLKINEGAGAFVCGEETALMASIEGKRGMPHPRPPFPAQSGLWGYPTNINNVETWASTAAIMQNSAQWFASYGTVKSKGTKTFSLTGKVNYTGFIEIPLGMTLHEVVCNIGGGIQDGKQFKAVQTGGPSGGILPASLDHLSVDYESLGQAGSIMGSGGIVVVDEDTCVVDMARYFLTFTQSESCGKCVPCRAGTKQILTILENICGGRGKPEDIDRLLDLSNKVKRSALCGLGQTAPNPVLTSLKYFKDEYIAHVNEKRCSSLMCRELLTFYIDPEKCRACALCIKSCPVEAIRGGKKLVHVIDQNKCIKCAACLDACPAKFSAVVKASGEKINVPAEPGPIGEKK